MLDLICDHIGTIGCEEQRHPNAKWRTMDQILHQWSLKDPSPMMLTYLTLIIKTHMESAGDAWLVYNRVFKQRAATDPGVFWAMIDPSHWSLALSGRAKASWYKHYFIYIVYPVLLKNVSGPCQCLVANPLCIQVATSVLIGTRNLPRTNMHVCIYCAQVLTSSTSLLFLLATWHLRGEEEVNPSVHGDNKLNGHTRISHLPQTYSV